MRIVRMVSDPNRTAHRHPHSVEVVFVKEGSGTLWIEGTRTRIQEGDSILVPQGMKHATLPDPNSEMQLICFFPDADFSNNIEEIDEVLS
ncbi:MAG TPA: cupin domain-containing protein [Candidatus Nanopelagicaceae bacterium]|nr:cupin domain-containing protein [Candidatus Nanopelagicaceae bacterium]